MRLGEFWRRSGLSNKPRSAQFTFFEYLRQIVPTLTHIGMRSGNLEAYAYMGHRVIFLEEQGRTDAVRMDKLVTSGLHLKYRTVKLNQLPTRTGQMLVQHQAFKLRVRALRAIANNILTPNGQVKPKLGKHSNLNPAEIEFVKKFKAEDDAIARSGLPDYQQDLRRYRFLKGRDSTIRQLLLGVNRGFGNVDLLTMLLTQTLAFPLPDIQTLPDLS